MIISHFSNALKRLRGPEGFRRGLLETAGFVLGCIGFAVGCESDDSAHQSTKHFLLPNPFGALADLK